MRTRFARHTYPTVCLSLALLSFSTSAAFAQCGSLGAPSTSAVSAGGDFNTAATWSAGVPTGATNACIVNAGPTTVTLAASQTGNVLSLQVNSNNTLNVSNNATLNVNGPQIINGGAISLNSAANNSILGLSASTTLSGTGTLTLSESGGGGVFILQNVGGVTLTNSSNIVGAGVIGNGGLALSNSGTINANSSGQTLFLNGSGGNTNTGLLEATGGGTLRLDSSVANAGGNITANGGTVNVVTTINGGTLNSSGGGTLQTLANNTATLNGVTLSSGSTYTNGNNSDLNVSGTINNKSSIVVTTGVNNSILGLNGDTTLTGGGTVTMTQTSSGGVFIQQNVGGVTLTNTNNTIQGAGTIGNGGLTLINNSTINANTSGQTLTLNGSGGVTNNSLLEATSGGTLRLDSTVANTGGNITANGGTVNLVTTINGGTLNSSGGGTLQTLANNTATLNGVTLSSGSTYTNGNNSDLNVSGTINNKGSIVVTTGVNNSILGLNGDTTLTGGGTVTMTQTSSGGVFIQQNVGGVTLTNTNNTIQGAGTIGNGGLAVINNSTINANTSGQTLTLNGSGGVTNNGGLLEATSGGTLQISNTINNANGTITAGNGSAVLVNGTIQGGTLNTLGTGTMGTNLNSISALDGTTQGALTISAGSTYTNGNNSDVFVNGTINNKGTIVLTSGANNSILGLNNNTTLTGGGTVTLTQTGAGGVFVQQNVGGLTLTNTNNTIQGAGVIGNGGLAVINNSTINANAAGQTLTVNGSGGFTNNGGLLEATGGGTLQISTTINNANGNITAGNGSAVLSNSTIQGGTLNTLGTGTMGTNPNNISALDGTTHGALTISAGSTYTNGNNSDLFVNGTINNKGMIAVTAGVNNSILGLNNNTTLTGGGTVTMAQGSGGAFLQQNAGGLTLTNADNTIRGFGTIGNGGLAVNNQAAGLINAGTNGKTLLVNGSGGLTNAGTLEASGGGYLLASAPLASAANGGFTGGTLTGNYIVDGLAGNKSTLQINALGGGGGEVTQLGNGALKSSITLNGLNANTLFTDASGVNNALALGSVTANATLTVEGGYSMTTPGGLSNAGNVHVGSSSSLLKVTGAYNQSAGTTVIDAGGTLMSSAFNLNGGTAQVDGTLDPPVFIAFGAELFGTGNIVGNVDNAGTIFGGDSASILGTLSDTGNYQQDATGTILEDILSASLFSKLDFTGNVTDAVGAQINIGELGFTPDPGELFKILTFGGTLTGQNYGVTGIDASDFDVLYNAHDITLRWNQGGGPPPPTPEPKFLLLDVALSGPLAGMEV